MDQEMVFNEEDFQVMESYSGGFFKVNKKLALILGYREAAFFDYLLSSLKYFGMDSKLEDGYMFITTDKIEKDFKVPYKTQYRMFQKLEEVGLLKSFIKKDGGRKYITVDFQKLKELIK